MFKPLFCADVTEDEENEALWPDEFCIKEVPDSERAALDRATDDAVAEEEKAALPRFLSILKWGFCAIGLVLVAGILKSDVPLRDAYGAAPYLFWIAGVSFVLFGVLEICSTLKGKEVRASSAYTHSQERVELETKRIFDRLGVPADAMPLDLLLLDYVCREEEPSWDIKPEKDDLVINGEMKVYVQDGCLCLADTEGVYAFPLAECRAIRTVEHKTKLMFWHRPEPINAPAYKEYRLKKDDMDNVTVRSYHVLILEHGGDEYGIYFAPYDLPTVQRLTGLVAEANN